MDNSFEGFGVMYSKESGLLDTEDEGTIISRNVKNCSTIDTAQHPEDWRIRFDSSWKSHNQPHMIVPSGPEYPKDFRKYIKANRPNIFVWTLCHWRPPSHLLAL